MPSIVKSPPTKTPLAKTTSLLPNVDDAVDDDDEANSSSDDEVVLNHESSLTSRPPPPPAPPASNASNKENVKTTSTTTTAKGSNGFKVTDESCVFQCGGCRTIISDGLVGMSRVKGVRNTVPLDRMETINPSSLTPPYKSVQCRTCKKKLGKFCNGTFTLNLSSVVTTVLGLYHECAPSFEHLQVPYEPPPSIKASRPSTSEPKSKRHKPSPSMAEANMTLAARVKMLEEFLVFHEKRIKHLEAKNGIKVKT